MDIVETSALPGDRHKQRDMQRSGQVSRKHVDRYAVKCCFFLCHYIAL